MWDCSFVSQTVSHVMKLNLLILITFLKKYASLSKFLKRISLNKKLRIPNIRNWETGLGTKSGIWERRMLAGSWSRRGKAGSCRH